MDQAVEAVLATLIFFLFISIISCVSLGLFASVIARGTGAVLNDYALIVSSVVTVENGNHASSWNLWSPSSDPFDFGFSNGLHVAINASSFYINSDGNTTCIWTKSTGNPPAHAYAGVCERLVTLDDNSVVLMSVVVW